MTTIKYSAGRLLSGAIIGSLLVALGVWMPDTYHRHAWFAGVIILVFGLILAVACLRMLATDRVALKFGQSGIRYKTLYRQGEIRWQDIREIGVETTTINFIATQHHLKIDTGGGMFRNCTIPGTFLSRSHGSLHEVVDQMVDCLVRAEANGFPARQSAQKPIAARKIEPQPISSGFGRKGL